MVPAAAEQQQQQQRTLETTVHFLEAVVLAVSEVYLINMSTSPPGAYERTTDRTLTIASLTFMKDVTPNL